MKSREQLEKEFDAAMYDIYRKVLKETGYKASYFLKMLDEQKGVATAMQLIYASRPSEGYFKLHSFKRLDLTVEALVLQLKWMDIFSDSDRAAAKNRLVAYDFDFSAHGL